MTRESSQTRLVSHNFIVNQYFSLNIKLDIDKYLCEKQNIYRYFLPNTYSIIESIILSITIA